jgi:hypothetical protein
VEKRKMRMKASLVFLLIVFLLVSLLPMSALFVGSCSGAGTVAFGSSPTTEWTQTYGGTGFDIAYSVVETADGGYAMVGYTSSFGLAGSEDFWLVKTDSVGTMEWNKTYGGTEAEEAFSLIKTSDGGYALLGWTNSFGAGGVDVFLVKTSSDGNLEWYRTFGGISWDEGESIVQTSDGGYAILGYTQSFGAGSSDLWLIKTNSTGSMLWNKTYGGADAEHAFRDHALIQTSDDGYAIAGGTKSSGAGLEDFWLIRTDANGGVLWNKTYGGASDDVAWSLVQANEGGYVLAGYTESFGAGSRDAWLVETDSAGNEVWNRTYGGTGDDRAISLLETLDGGYAFAGYSSPYVVGGTDFWLVKTDSSGNMQWNKTCGGENEDYVQSLVQTNDEGYAMVGGTYSYGAGSCDFWLVKIASELHDVAITNLLLSEASAIQGQTILINVTVENQGEYAETFNVTTYYNCTTIESKTINDLTEGDQTSLTFNWDTTGVLPGNYVIHANASAVTYETDIADNTMNVSATIQLALSGKVTEIDGITPVIDASVEALQEGDAVILSTTTDSQGFYSLIPPVGAYKLLVRVVDHLDAVRSLVNITTETMTDVNFNLTRGQMIVFDDFVGTNLNTSKWEGTLGGWGNIGNVTSEPTRFSKVELSTQDTHQGVLRSKDNATLDSIIIFEGRISAYTPTGDKQPRGLRVGTDPNNAIEFISWTLYQAKARTVASGVATETLYTLPSGKTVGDWNLTYRIEANSTCARFYINGLLIATHTTNIPTGPLNIYMDTYYPYAGNIPIAADYLYMAVKLSTSILPSSVVMDLGTSRLFTSSVSGGTPPYSYQWYLNDAPVSEATSSSWRFVPSASGSYTVYVYVTDSIGLTAKSNVAIVTVNPFFNAGIAPVSVVLDVNQSQVFVSIIFGGTFPFTYQWYLDGSPIPGANNTTWTYTPSSSGSHTVYYFAHDAVGNVAGSIPVPVTVHDIPSVIVSPSIVTMDIGQSQLLAASVSDGTSPYSYQWYLDDSIVSGATSATWTFAPASPGSHSVYVNVTDNVGAEAKSNIATVTVLTHDVALTDVAPSRITVTQGYGLNVSVTVKNFGNYTETFNVTLYANGIPVHTFTNVALTPGSTTILTIEAGFTKGFYTLSAYAWPLPDEVHTSDNSCTCSDVIVVAPRATASFIYARPVMV